MFSNNINNFVNLTFSVPTKNGIGAFFLRTFSVLGDVFVYSPGSRCPPPPLSAGGGCCCGSRLELDSSSSSAAVCGGPERGCPPHHHSSFIFISIVHCETEKPLGHTHARHHKTDHFCIKCLKSQKRK